VNLADIAIKRPIFVACIVILSLAAGLLCMSKLGVDLFPDVTFPVVTVTTPYPGAGPREVETLVTKPIEDELSSISGIKRITSENREGFSVVIAEFFLETDVKNDEQQVRDHVGSVKAKLPLDIKEPSIARIDPSDQPIVQVSLDAKLSPAQLYDLADDRLKPMIEQVPSIGKIDILGGRKREIQVALDRRKLKQYEVSASQISARLEGSGLDIPSGKKNKGTQETSFRTLGEFSSIQDISSLVINFFGNENAVRIGDVATVTDTLEDEQTRAFANGSPTLFINIYKQSGSNTVKVADDIKKKITQINKNFADQPGHPQLTLVRDGAQAVRINVDDVKESIFIGIVLAVLVVYLFLGNFRSTIITGLALPNSLLGSFILMYIAGYTINIMSLLALTLSVGLLVDDAIVVRENIFRHIEMGKNAIRAALEGTGEVRLAVIATTLTIVAVFGPLGFLSGVVGQFFKQFGLTVVFAMLISLFDALTIAPMLSAYFAGKNHGEIKNPIYRYTLGPILKGFSRFQDHLENYYEALIRKILKAPLWTLAISVAVFILCMMTSRYVPSTFLPTNDSGEFMVTLDMPPGVNLDGMSEVAMKVDEVIRKNPEVVMSALTVGSATGDSNQANFYIRLVDSKKRKLNTTQVKNKMREELKEFASANPIVKDYDPVGAGERQFTLNILGTDQAELEKIALRLKQKLSTNTQLVDVDVNFRPGKPEFQVRPIKSKTESMGMTVASVGNELRTQIEGLTPAKFRENGLEYDIRVRLQEDQRDLAASFKDTWVPNVNNSLIRLTSVADPVSTTGPSKTTRQDRTKYVQVNADIRSGGGLGNVMDEVTQLLSTGEYKLPMGYEFKFVGQGESFQELGVSIVTAIGAGILFIFLVLASLYESFVTPLTIMLAMPFAFCGSFVALAIMHESMNIFSMIGLVMLLGVAVKNSILLVDYAQQLIQAGATRSEAILKSGKTRLRPILMTSMALVAGTLPIALGLNEASRQRTSMGVAIIGGLVSSTLLTLIVVPAAFSYVDRFREWAKNFLGRLFIQDYDNHEK
jgi:HAE1 family hydrophobic/amphiphilic exporter-1